MGAREQLAQLHRARFAAVGGHIAPGELLLDTGSARAEAVPEWPVPTGNEDFGGFIVVTDRQVIYRDRFGTLPMPWDTIRGMEKYRVRGLMTTGIEVRFADGSVWRFSGNSPFIRSLLRISR